MSNEKIVQVAISELAPNHHRDIDSYPIDRRKVDALKASFKQTGFWGNIVARKNGAGFEIAYGHHRLVALKESYKASTKVPIIVRPIDDSSMLKMMAQENMEEWGSSAFVELQTVAAVVVAYARGEIALERPPATSKREWRYAPTYQRARAGGLAPYTASTIAHFLGWQKPSGKAQDKVSLYLNALELIELGAMRRAQFKDLTTEQALTTIEEAMRTRQAELRVARAKAASATQEEERAAKATSDRDRRDAERTAVRLRIESKEHEKRATTEAARVGESLAKDYEKGTISTKQARDRALEIRSQRTGKKVDPKPLLADVVPYLCREIAKVFTDDRIAKRLAEVVKWRKHLEDRDRKSIAKELDRLVDRVSSLKKSLMR